MRTRKVEEFFVGDRIYLTAENVKGEVVGLTTVSITASQLTFFTPGPHILVRWDSDSEIYIVLLKSAVKNCVLIENEDFTEKECATLSPEAVNQIIRETFNNEYWFAKFGTQTEYLRDVIKTNLHEIQTAWIGKGKTTALIKEIIKLLDTYDPKALVPNGVPTICVAVTPSVDVTHIVNEIFNHVGGKSCFSRDSLHIRNWAIQFVDVTNTQTYAIEGRDIVVLFITHEVVDTMIEEFRSDVLSDFKLPRKMDTICDLIGNIRARINCCRSRMENTNA
jgi:hypothetical protein